MLEGPAVGAVDDLAFLFRGQLVLSRPWPGAGISGHDATERLDFGHDLREVEVAELLDVKPSSVSTHVARGLAALRTKLGVDDV